MKNVLPVLLIAAMLTGCAAEESPRTVADWLPPIENRADSIALRVFDAYGGADAWARVRYVRFDFGRESDAGKQVFRSHLWDRHAGDYRLEYTVGEDSTAVVLFNVNDRSGTAFINGEPLDSAATDDHVQRAYQGFINDTYWLLAPIKLLDPGVTRAYVPDSSSAGVDVITTTYEGVGLTPGDQFWFWVDRDTGMMTRWAYQLQGRKDQPPTSWMWMECTEFEHSAGPVVICPRKSRGDSSLMTDRVDLPETVAEDAFSRPTPML